jgi:EAL domain-containing protein (putative c-di-GMP-specific phosphodiesterase class I)/GGDEF domain-containing protein
MTLMRQIGALLAAVVLLALAGAVGVNLHAARDTLQTQLKVKNSDNAQSLALALSQQRGDAALMELLLSAQFDTGFYREVRLLRPDGSVAFERQATARPAAAPAWFSALLPIESVAGVAQVSDGWRALGRVEVVSQVAYAHDELWRGGSRSALLLLALGALAMLLAAAGVRRIRRPLDATVEQANALVEGRYLMVEEPRVPELQRVARAMNGMVERVRRLFEAQAAQVEELRRAAHEDAVTGLAHRTHFVQRLNALLGDEGGAAAGCLLLVRVADLAGVNRKLGHHATNQLLRAVADVLRRRVGTEPGVAGRLNGSDFALALPGRTPATEAARELAQALREAMAPVEPTLAAHVGAVDWTSLGPSGPLLARADLALARAEGGAAFAAHVEPSDGGRTAGAGEERWRRSLHEALQGGRARLVEFAVLSRDGSLSHLECPLRVQLEPDGDYEPAARWLPLAARSRLLPALDLMAVREAMRLIAADGESRAVNLALASIADGGFAAQLRALLEADTQAAARLWLEVGEGAASAQRDLLQAFSRLVRPLGVRFGLEHAGHELYRAPRLYELGLDYVKLDAALVRAAARDEAVRRFVASGVSLLHTLPLLVCAEGVDDAADALALWDCGVDAITGPWVKWPTPGAA